MGQRSQNLGYGSIYASKQTLTARRIEFKKKLITDFGNTDVFRHKALRQFSQMDQPLQTVQELAVVLVPTINTLKSHIQCVATFHDHDLLYTNMLSPTLIDTILNCIPPPPLFAKPFFLDSPPLKKLNLRINLQS